MPMQVPNDVTGLLAGWQRGDRDALEKLAPYVYEELHRVAASYMRYCRLSADDVVLDDD